MEFFKKILTYIDVAITWTKLTIHNTWGIINVFFIVWIRPMKGGLLSESHPMASGINPLTNKLIWPENIIFKSLRLEEDNFATDEEIVTEVGHHLRRMVLNSASSKAFPNGKPDRMPPAINYIHGSVHYNGGFLLFNDFKDAIKHFTNLDFQIAFKKFVEIEKREPVTIFRNKNYDRMEYLEFVCFLRTIFPWFSNNNGNKKRIGWGNPAPYPSVNTITGNWMQDTYKIYSAKGRETVCRPPITTNYFTKKSYVGNRSYVLPEEKFLADFTNSRVLARGRKGNMFFVDLRKLSSGYRFDPSQNLPNILQRIPEKFSNHISKFRISEFK